MDNVNRERERGKKRRRHVQRLVEGRRGRGERVEEMSSDGDQESNTYPIDRVFSLGERRSNGGECSHIKRREESYWRARGMGPGGGPSFSDSGTLIRSPPTLLVTASPIVFLHRPSSCTPLLAPSFPPRIYFETLVASIRPRWEVQPWESTVNPSDDLGYIGYRVVGFLIINWSV